MRQPPEGASCPRAEGFLTRLGPSPCWTPRHLSAPLWQTGEGWQPGAWALREQLCPGLNISLHLDLITPTLPTGRRHHLLPMVFIKPHVCIYLLITRMGRIGSSAPMRNGR